MSEILRVECLKASLFSIKKVIHVGISFHSPDGQEIILTGEHSRKKMWLEVFSYVNKID